MRNRVTTTAIVSIACDNEGENARECRRLLSRKRVKKKSVEEKRVKDRGPGDLKYYLRRRGAVEALEALGDSESQGGRLM